MLRISLVEMDRVRINGDQLTLPTAWVHEPTLTLYARLVRIALASIGGRTESLSELARQVGIPHWQLRMPLDELVAAGQVEVVRTPGGRPSTRPLHVRQRNPEAARKGIVGVRSMAGQAR